MRKFFIAFLLGFLMAFPAIAAVGNTNGSTAATNKVCTLPANIASGDLLLVELRSNAADTHSLPAGWSWLVQNDATDASNDVTSIIRRVADGTEGGSVTINGTASTKFTSVSLRVTGHDAATAPAISAIATGTDAAPNSAALTPAGGAKDYLWLTLAAYEGQQTDPPTFPANYTLGQVSASSGIGGAAATNSRSASAGRQLTAATEDPGAYTISAAGSWSAWTIAVYPGPVVVGATESLQAGLGDGLGTLLALLIPADSLGILALETPVTVVFLDPTETLAAAAAGEAYSFSLVLSDTDSSRIALAEVQDSLQVRVDPAEALPVALGEVPDGVLVRVNPGETVLLSFTEATSLLAQVAAAAEALAAAALDGPSGVLSVFSTSDLASVGAGDGGSAEDQGGVVSGHGRGHIAAAITVAVAASLRNIR